ncbi:duboraya isoform X1 [Hippocampus zosterae]|uniref:duboraya isoform X1 n=1 Tax=Hippocampus zosterae TaxID=109293 RepID=UPI00223DAC88|nr:duboraya isoform X1 [Hippocampus zosterae]XP_051903505.1 duboraya isoform X1 [Hippocampus zosterae]
MQEGHGRENEEQTASRPSVAKLAGMFKGSSPPPASETLQEKPVRRRPPRSLQLPKSHGDEHERPSGVTSPVKAKRNSALIEKLQANLALSPANLLPSPKSPGFRLLPPFSPPSSPSPTAGTPSPTLTSPSSISTSLVTEEEGPVSFEAPPTAAEGSLLMNVNKSRARHSLRRRPPSRRHRKSSNGEEVDTAGEETDTPASQPNQKTTQGAGGDDVGDENRNHLKEDKSEETPKKGQINCDIHLREEEENKKQVAGEEKDTQDGVRVEGENQETTSGESPNNKEEEDKSHGSTWQS